MSKNISQSPPLWCPTAIPTSKGWVDPKTGEVLVARKDLSVPNNRNKPKLTEVVEHTAPQIPDTDELEDKSQIVENVRPRFKAKRQRKSKDI